MGGEGENERGREKERQKTREKVFCSMEGPLLSLVSLFNVWFSAKR